MKTITPVDESVFVERSLSFSGGDRAGFCRQYVEPSVAVRPGVGMGCSWRSRGAVLPSSVQACHSEHNPAYGPLGLELCHKWTGSLVSSPGLGWRGPCPA